VRGELPPYAAGAHLAVQCGADRIRHYSLCGGDGGCYEIGVKLAADTRGGSRWMFDHAAPGARLRVSAPRNQFPLDEREPGHLFLSGGIGVTPILAMLQRLKTLGRRARLVHLCRSRADLAFRDRLKDLAGFHDVHLHVDAEAGGLYDLQAELAATPPSFGVYCCGPGPMMQAVKDWGERAGRGDSFHFEFFAPVAAPPAEADGEFVVVQNSTGRRIAVAPDKTMLAALREAGLEMKSECEYGVCGWCAVGVVAGEPRHFDSYLTAAERDANKLVLPCVSRCASPTLVLDI